MTPEYVVLGAILILMGIVQVWLRHGPGSKERTEAGSNRPAGEHPPDGKRTDESYYPGRIRSGRAWEAWTAILGGVGIAVGIALVVVGLLGR